MNHIELAQKTLAVEKVKNSTTCGELYDLLESAGHVHERS